MQNSKMDVRTAVLLLENCIKFLQDYRITGHTEAIKSAEKLALQLNVEPKFRVTRVIRRKKQFNYESRDEASKPQNPELYFKQHVFNNILDRAISSISERFEKIKEFNDIWGFLYNIKENKNHEDLLKSCKDLHLKLNDQNKDKTECDLNGIDLCNEIEIVRSLYSKKDSCPLEILTFINDKKLQDTLPNLWVALRIMMTIPVTTQAAREVSAN